MATIQLHIFEDGGVPLHVAQHVARQIRASLETTTNDIQCLTAVNAVLLHQYIDSRQHILVVLAPLVSDRLDLAPDIHQLVTSHAKELPCQPRGLHQPLVVVVPPLERGDGTADAEDGEDDRIGEEHLQRGTERLELRGQSGDDVTASLARQHLEGIAELAIHADSLQHHVHIVASCNRVVADVALELAHVRRQVLQVGIHLVNLGKHGLTHRAVLLLIGQLLVSHLHLLQLKGELLITSLRGIQFLVLVVQHPRQLLHGCLRLAVLALNLDPLLVCLLLCDVALLHFLAQLLLLVLQRLHAGLLLDEALDVLVSRAYDAPSHVENALVLVEGIPLDLVLLLDLREFPADGVGRLADDLLLLLDRLVHLCGGFLRLLHAAGDDGVDLLDVTHRLHLHLDGGGCRTYHFEIDVLDFGYL